MSDHPQPPKEPRPSRLARSALRLLLPRDDRDAVLSELRELWQLRVDRDGEASARRWYARQLRGYPLRLLRDRLRKRTVPAMGALRGSVTAHGDRGGTLAGVSGDVRHALRGWAKSPLSALTIVLTVGLGLGASTAMLAVIREVLLNPLPYEDSDRLVRIYHAIGGNRWNLSVADFQAIESQQTSFEAVAAYSSDERTLTVGSLVERVRVRSVTAGWFDLFGLSAARGRTFEAGDGAVGAPSTCVVSWGLWQRSLGADATLGRNIRLDGRDFTVIGILPREVGPFEERYDVFPVLQFEPPARKGPFLLTVAGRVRKGIAPPAAAAELMAINDRIFPIWQSSFQDTEATWGMMPLDEFVIGRFRTMLFALLGAVLMVLLVASTNAAGLLTARVSERRAELAMRAALGASGSRLMRLVVTESVLLALGGAALGIALAAAVIRAIRTAGPDFLPRAGAIALDGEVLVFAALLAGASLILFGVLPALELSGARAGIAMTLRGSPRTASVGPSAHKARRALVATQFAVAVPLVAGAALLVNSFVRLQGVDPGFDGDHVVTIGIARRSATEGSPADRAFWDRLHERVGALPGVLAAGLSDGRPPRGANNINNFDPLDRPTPVGKTEPMAVWLIASPGYFDTLRIGLLSGRMFDERDGPDLGFTSALVDRTWADNVYPGESPIGKELYEGGCRGAECNLVRVVGVVENVRYLGLDDSQRGAAVGTVYVPQSQWLAPSSNLFVRASGDPLLLVGSIRAIVQELESRGSAHPHRHRGRPRR